MTAEYQAEVLKWAEVWKDLILKMGGEPYTAYVVAAEWCRGLLVVRTTREGKGD